MAKTIIIVLLALGLASTIKAKQPAHPHLHSEVRLVDYYGPTDKHIFSLFKNVEILEIFNSTLTESPPRIYSLLPKLKKVHVENNTYIDIHDDEVLHGALNLEEFYIINITIHKIHLHTVRSLPKLRILVIRSLSEPHKVLKSDSLNETNMHVFEFSDNGVEIVEDLAFNGLGKLEDLNLANNKLKSLSIAVLQPLKNLKILDLSGNQFEKFGVDNLPELPSLEKINLSRNPLSKLNLDGIEKVAPKLKTLILTETAISEAELKEIKEKTKLEIINK